MFEIWGFHGGEYEHGGALVPIRSQINPVYTLPRYLLGSILILSFHLRLSLPSCLLPSGFPAKMLYVFLVSPCALDNLSSYTTRFDNPNNIWWKVQIMELLIMQFLQPRGT
jgi:hypothetical protein